MTLEFSKRLETIPYYPAAEGYSLAGDVALLASNESPFPPHPDVIQAIAAVAGRLNRYPDPTNFALKHALSARYGVAASRIAVGNGSTDLMWAAGEALLEPGAEVIYGWPSFSAYRQVAGAAEATSIEVPLDVDDRYDLNAALREVTVATRLVIVCNPNNPTSTAVSFSDIEAFIAAMPKHVCIMLDEAYCEFNLLNDSDETIALLDSYPNLVLLRTFSKVYGLSGLRIGFALCGSEQFAQAVDRVRQPFFCSAVGQAAAIEALNHQDDVARRVERTVIGRLALEEGLQSQGFSPAESQTNFVWFDLGDGVDDQEIVEALSALGVLVRSGSSLGREGCLRVTVGTELENQRFLAALKEVVT